MLCAFMGWPAELHEPLRQWARKNQTATLAGDRPTMAAIAFEFDGHIRAEAISAGRRHSLAATSPRGCCAKPLTGGA
jgi:hypothetical protein